MSGAVVTGSFVMASLGAYYLLHREHEVHGRLFVKIGVAVAFFFSVLQIFPTGDNQGRMIALHQPATLAAMEANFKTEQHAPLVIIGQPNTAERKLDNKIEVPSMLSFLSYRRWNAEVKGLDQFKPEDVTDNIALLYYSYHIMVGLGTIFVAIMSLAMFLLWRDKLTQARWMLWILMFSFPFPYIANTAGWITAEVGRQPWLVYGLLRTSQGFSRNVSAGNGIFSLLGFMGLYMVLGILFLFLVWKEVMHGPEAIPLEAAVTAGATAGT
jgi:cytochrome d ubiquinol oxidase subunit I